MTPRHLWLHAAALGLAAASLLLAAVASLTVIPRLPPESQSLGWVIAAWQVALAAIIAGTAVRNLSWGFITARPMWVMIVASALTGWLIPLSVWAFRVWRDERTYLETENRRMLDAKGRRTEVRGQQESASKDSPAS